jgi:hypothetical protein
MMAGMQLMLPAAQTTARWFPAVHKGVLRSIVTYGAKKIMITSTIYLPNLTLKQIHQNKTELLMPSDALANDVKPVYS